MNKLVITALAACLTYATRATGAEPARYARFDVYTVDQAFELLEPRTVGRAYIGPCGWLGAGKEKTGLHCAVRLERDWKELVAEFTAGGDGEVWIQLQGASYEMQSADDVRLIWVDDVRVDGAAITNGDFELVGPDGLPVGWSGPSPFPPERFSRDGTVARSGKACVAVWQGGALRQAFAVQTGRRYRVSAWFRAYDPARIPEPLYVPFEFPFETYRQRFEIVFKTPAAARRATVELCPLFNDYEWSVSCRWDDNNPENIKMRDVLARHGYRATWYLNGPYRDWTAVTPGYTNQFGFDLLQGGNTIGGHSLTHPMLSYCSRNRIFEETAGVRIAWEAAANTRVLSYSFSYCNFFNPQEGFAVQADITRALQRAGLYHLASEPQFEDLKTDMILSPIMPGDGADIDGFAEAALADPAYRAAHPNLTFSMHVWYRTPEAWAKFEDQLDKYGRRRGWWYCNQNEYAAYRYQFQHTRLATHCRGRTVRVLLQRPALLDLNDPVPLTCRVSGVAGDEIETIRCATAAWTPVDGPDALYRFNLFHDRSLFLPDTIGLVPPNLTNRATLGAQDCDSRFPGVKALLCFQDGRLRLTLENSGSDPLEQLRVTYRLPLAWREGVVRRHLGAVRPGTVRQDALRPTLERSDYKYNSYRYFFVAQLDFLRGGKPGRLHVVCSVPLERTDPSYPQGGFLRLGPFPPELVDLKKLAEDWRAGRVGTQPWFLSDDARLTWEPDDGLTALPYSDVEIVQIPIAWSGPPACYALQSELHSPRAQVLNATFLNATPLLVALNGEALADFRQLSLQSGTNRLLIVTHRAGYGPYLRLTRPGTSERASDVRFARPAVPAGETNPYKPAAVANHLTRKQLAGKWRACLTAPLPPAPRDQMHPDPGISPAARRLLSAEVDDAAFEEVEVPGRWDRYGGRWADVDGEAVFRKAVEIPSEWTGRDLLLSLGSIDDFDDTYFNGQPVGRTDQTVPEFYTAPRLYRIPAALVRPGCNIIAVRMFDHFGDGGFTGDPLSLFIAPAP